METVSLGFLQSNFLFFHACIMDRFLLGSIYILEALRSQLSFIREFMVGFNGLSVNNPSSESNKNTLSSNMLGHALKFMNTASRVSTRVQGNITREVGTEVYNTFVDNKPKSQIPTTNTLFSPTSRTSITPAPPSSYALAAKLDIAPWEDDEDEGEAESEAAEAEAEAELREAADGEAEAELREAADGEAEAEAELREAADTEAEADTDTDTDTAPTIESIDSFLDANMSR
jgi:hypothetical protein